MISGSFPPNLSLTGLHRRWWIVLFFYIGLLWLGYNLLNQEWRPVYARRWVVPATAVLGYELWLFRRWLRDNHRLGETELLSTLGPGNIFTLLRGLLIGLLAGFLFCPRPSDDWLAWGPALLYTLAGIVDYLDGYLARISHHATLLGEKLDQEYDALGILVSAVLVVHYGQLPAWYLLVGLSRYFFIGGLWWLRQRGKSIYNLPSSTGRRVIAGFQMGFISVILWPLFSPPATIIAGVLFILPFLASFFRDWLVVSGSLDPAAPFYLMVSRKIKFVVGWWLPVPLRIMVVVLAIKLILTDVTAWPILLAWPGTPFPELTSLSLGLLVALTAFMLALGFMGRLAALGLLTATGATILTSGLHWANGFLLAGTLTLILAGSGALSLWRPEEAILNRRAGEDK